MLWSSLAPSTMLGLLGFSMVVTALTDWWASRLLRHSQRERPRLPVAVAVLASLGWVLLAFSAGIVAARYIQRVSYPLLGYTVFALVLFFLSWLRAYLFTRIVHQWRSRQERTRPRGHFLVSQAALVHHATYLLFALVFFLSISWLASSSVGPTALLLLVIGALLPDLDSTDSPLGRLLPFASDPIKARVGTLQVWHSLGANVLLAAITMPLIWVLDLRAWSALSLGFLSHLIVDLLAPEGIMLLWPLSRTRLRLGEGYLQEAGAREERRLAAGLLLVALVFVFAADLGEPSVPSAPNPTYAQTLDRYHSLRGRNLVYAQIEGVWQATGRRSSGRFEILNLLGESYILLDRFTGAVFTAGRDASNDFYLDRITLQVGSSAAVKPAEVHLEDQLLGDSLDLLYELQQEPGLQHLYVSGELLLDTLVDEANADLLAPELSLLRLHRVEAVTDGRYRLFYMPASAFVSLANIRVQRADLVFVATATRPVTGPTVTPLPSPPAAPELHQP